jgi:hypothetical protein
MKNSGKRQPLLKVAGCMLQVAGCRLTLSLDDINNFYKLENSLIINE